MRSLPAKPLSPSQIEKLDSFLQSREEALDLEQMDGFMAAVACSHEFIPPSEMMGIIWGEGVFESMTQAEEIPALFFQHWNDILRLMASGKGFEPLLDETKEDNPLAQQWARGFVLGVGLLEDTWKEVFEDEDLASWMIALFLLADVDMPEIKEELQSLDPSDFDREEMLGFLMHGIGIYYAYFEQRSRKGHLDSGPARTVKVGRNEPCPCGSGLKYKRCCGR